MQGMTTDLANDADKRGEDYLTRVKRMFEEARDSTETARLEAERDDDYYHGRQWTSGELQELKRRKQPPITYNLVRVKVESICGVEEKTDTSPQAWPRTPQDEQAAEVATDTLRFVCDLNRFDKIRVDVLRNMLVSGTAGAIVEVKQKGGGQAQMMGTTALTPSAPLYDIIIRKLRWETIVYDPFSRETDFSDARYLGGALWMDEADVIATYGERAREATEAAIQDAGLARGSYAVDSYSDRPNYTWADQRRRRVLVVELYHREGQGWHHCVFTGGGLIMQGPSAYQDENGVPTCPIELVSAFVNRDNERYGIVRDMRSPQDEVNHRRSKLLHLLNTRQTWRQEGSIAAKDPKTFRRELNKPDGDVVLNKNSEWGKQVGIIDNATQMQGQAELLQEAKAFLDRLGPNAGLMGRGTEDQSGRAILAQQQAGLAELATIFAAHNDWVLRIYRQIWARARQFWTAPMFIRVTDDLGSPEFIKVNEIVGYEPQTDAMGNPVIDWQRMQPVMKPVVQNRLAEMGVDLIVDRVPHTANLQAEEFKTLAELAQGGMPIPPQAIIMASTLRNKRQILDMIEKMQQQAAGAGAPPPEAVAAELDNKVANTELTRAKAQKTAIEAGKLVADTVHPPQPASPAGPLPVGMQ